MKVSLAPIQDQAGGAKGRGSLPGCKYVSSMVNLCETWPDTRPIFLVEGKTSTVETSALVSWVCE